MERNIDHVVCVVTDLEAAGKRFEDFGFTVTPPARHPFGTENRLAIFDDFYIELLAITQKEKVVPMTLGNFSFSAYNERFSRLRQGMSMVVLSSNDAKSDHERLREQGVETFSPVRFSRKAPLPDGSEVTVSFTSVFVHNKMLPDSVFFYCQHHNPEDIWRNEYCFHKNTAKKLVSVTAVAKDPCRFADYIFHLFNNSRVDLKTGLTTGNAKNAVLEMVPQNRLKGRFSFYREMKIGFNPCFIGLKIKVEDPGIVEDLLIRNRIPYEKNGHIYIHSRHAYGMVLEFE